jgi:hypothetical protein
MVELGLYMVSFWTTTPFMQRSRLKPSYEFHFEGRSNFNPPIEGLVKIQDVNQRI